MNCQSELDTYSHWMDKYTTMKSIDYWGSTRSILFKARFYMYLGLFNNHYKIPFNFVRPGLEMKYACEEAANVGAKTYFLGPEFNQDTWLRLHHETRTTLLSYVKNYFAYSGLYGWTAEKKDIINRLQNSEPSQFTEQCADPYLMNWFV